MKVKMLPSFVLLLFALNSFSQVTQIETKDGIHYITTVIEDYTITGTYYFKEAEPTVELGAGGNGFYQLHEQPKRAVAWGIECDEAGVPIFKKGYDNAAYTLWYQYTARTDADDDDGMMWKPVPFTIHFNSNKMFIQGERCKSF